MTQKQELLHKLREFNQKRDWSQYHTYKDLACALAIEASELQEHFLWKQPSHDFPQDKRQGIEEELADVYLYLLMFADKAQIDLDAIALKKIQKNEEKYPADKVKGSSKKYTEY